MWISTTIWYEYTYRYGERENNLAVLLAHTYEFPIRSNEPSAYLIDIVIL